MFYIEDSLKRGGRFYLVWIADSWPLRFAAITPRQLWSYDIRNLCSDLLQVMNTESGRPTKRFSLRLSSQLMRGLVRLYERQVSVFLGDLVMLNAHVFQSTNKKLNRQNKVRQPRTPRVVVQEVIEEQENEEQRVNQMLQNSGNIVVNVQDITLKEATIPEFQIPPNDNFGEENPEQQLREILGDRSMELMLQQPETSAAHASGLELPDMSDRSHDKSRLAPHDAPRMDRISELDLTMLRESMAQIVVPGEFNKDIVEIPEIPPPEVPALQPEIQVPAIDVTTAEVHQPTAVVSSPPRRSSRAGVQRSTETQPQPEEMELEDLEEAPRSRRRRVPHKLIVDKRTQIPSDLLRSRLEDPHVECKYESFKDSIIVLGVPSRLLLRRPAHVRTCDVRINNDLLGLFQRGLRYMCDVPVSHHEQQAMQRLLQGTGGDQASPEQGRLQPAPADVEMPLADVPREVLNVSHVPAAADVVNGTGDVSANVQNVTTNIFDVTGNVPDLTATVQNVSANVLDVTANVPEVFAPEKRVDAQEDISDLPTQVLQPLSQARHEELETPAKRRRVDVTTFYQNQSMQLAHTPVVLDKENVPPMSRGAAVHPALVRRAYAMSGVEEVQPAQLQQQVAGMSCVEAERRPASEGSETPLGSLDRTKVSLGDSIATTDSQKFIRFQWGAQNTMVRILKLMKSGRRPITVLKVVEAGPTLPGHRHIVAAKCFMSILKLKERRFINIIKDPNSLEIRDITLGPEFRFSK